MSRVPITMPAMAPAERWACESWERSAGARRWVEVGEGVVLEKVGEGLL